MDYYFLIITIIDVFVLGIMCVFTKCSDILNREQRNWFICSFLLIMVISVLEVITVTIDKGPASFRIVNIAANYLGFGLTPAVSVCLAAALGRSPSTKYALTAEGIYMLFMAVSYPLGLVFYVDKDNTYMRGDYFWIYLAAYFAGIIYLLLMTLEVSKKYQNKNKNTIYAVAVFLIIGTTVQVALPKLHVTWLCVSLLSILYYTYCTCMWQQLDALTGLLNQKSYLYHTGELSSRGTLIVFDIDDFKQVNDRYGHPTGDKCLREVAECIKHAYSKYGFCYRIGGDEFCVILKENADEESCYQKFIRELDTRRESLDILPFVSAGSAYFEAGDNALKVKEEADANMYRVKKEHKSGHQA
ncbi:MAG: GGDEF domain-containing protein [Anaerovoracaceae bacterium]